MHNKEAHVGINLTEVASDTATCQASYMGQLADVTYRPSVLTPEFVTKMNTLDLESMAAALDALVVDWDIKIGKGTNAKKVARTVEDLSAVPIKLLRAVTHAILGDSNAEGEA